MQACVQLQLHAQLAHGVSTAQPNIPQQFRIYPAQVLCSLCLTCAVAHVLQDIIRVRRAEGSLRAPVADHMTSPALTVGPQVAVRQAAKIMLQHKIRRLPVVDRNGHALG
jgi:predicted transcriptional regulator